MHTYVYCGTAHNTKDMKPTQMPIDNRQDKENVTHTHHGILCCYKKGWDHVHWGTWMKLKTIILSKQTQEQKIKHHMFSFIGGWWTMRTHGNREGNTAHWGLLRGIGEGQRGAGELGRDSMGRNARCGWREGRQENTLPCVYLCNYLACSAHVPQNLKCNKKRRKNK